jgi:hypothetical protein
VDIMAESHWYSELLQKTYIVGLPTELGSYLLWWIF